MNDPLPDDKLDTLFALARAHRPDTSAVEYAFETRLMARLGSARSADSIWAMVSWRSLPFFAACVIALTVWQSQVVSETNEAAAFASTENSEAVDLWNNFN